MAGGFLCWYPSVSSSCYSGGGQHRVSSGLNPAVLLGGRDWVGAGGKAWERHNRSFCVGNSVTSGPNNGSSTVLQEDQITTEEEEEQWLTCWNCYHPPFVTPPSFNFQRVFQKCFPFLPANVWKSDVVIAHFQLLLSTFHCVAEKSLTVAPALAPRVQSAQRAGRRLQGQNAELFTSAGLKLSMFSVLMFKNDNWCINSNIDSLIAIHFTRCALLS